MFKIRKLKALTLLTVVIYTVLLFLQLRQFRSDHNSMHTDANHHFHNQTVQESAVLVNNWKFNTSQKYDARQLYAWTTPPTRVMHLGHRTAQGENGTGYLPQPHEIALVNQSFASNNFNLYASDQISLRRTLPDMRVQECRRKQYPTALPRASIVIVLHNEPWSTLMRTIWSVVDRSPRELLEEIILVDDFSDLPHLFRPLYAYIKIFPVQLRLWRNKKREGLIRSRLVGAKLAKVVFFWTFLVNSDGTVQWTFLCAGECFDIFRCSHRGECRLATADVGTNRNGSLSDCGATNWLHPKGTNGL